MAGRLGMRRAGARAAGARGALAPARAENSGATDGTGYFGEKLPGAERPWERDFPGGPARTGEGDGPAPLWLPGSERPAHLDGTAPGDYGFDPLNLAASPGVIDRLQECELIHARWCMLAAAGILIPEACGLGSWTEAPKWTVEGGSPTYLGLEVPISLPAITGFELIVMATAESLRAEEKDPVKRCYPGGGLDFLNLSNTDEKKLRGLKTRELANGRLAMFAVLGMFSQASATGEGPWANFVHHVADPWHVNVANNGTSLPFLG